MLQQEVATSEVGDKCVTCVLQCVEIRFSLLQCVAVCCSVLQQEVATSRSVISVLHVCYICGTRVVYTTRITLVNTHVPSVL